MERRSHGTGRSTELENRDADDVFDALADAKRRRVLVGLLEEPRSVPTLSSSAERLVDGHEALLEQYLAGSGGCADVDDELLRERSVHLPKLAEYGFADWDREADVVRTGPRFDVVRPFLELLETPDARGRAAALAASRPGLPKTGR